MSVFDINILKNKITSHLDETKTPYSLHNVKQDHDSIVIFPISENEYQEIEIIIHEKICINCEKDMDKQQELRKMKVEAIKSMGDKT